MNPKSVFLAAAIIMVFAAISLAENLSADEARYVELVEPEALKGPMLDYEYDLYRLDADGPKYVEPPEYDYRYPIEFDYSVVRELHIATDEIAPASREVTIDLTLNLGSSYLVGDPIVVTYVIKPATQTVILGGGTATAEVEILPDAVDFYVAGKTPSGVFYFLTQTSGVKREYSRKIKPFLADTPITRLFGIIGVFYLDSQAAAGWYGVRAVMVSPGANVLNRNNWISNYSYGNSDADKNPLTPANFSFGVVN